MIRALLIALLLTGCGARPDLVWRGADADPVEIPLVQVWRAPRPLVEVWLGDQGPYLFALDSAAPEIVMARRLADLAALPRRHQPKGLDVARAPSLALGDPQGPRLKDVRCLLSPYEGFGEFEERPVVGILGRPFFEAITVELDPGAGALRLWRDAPPPPFGARAASLHDLGDDGWAVEIEAARWQIALGRPVSTTTPAHAAEAGLSAHPGPPAYWLAELDLPQIAPQIPLRPLGDVPDGIAGQLSHHAFAQDLDQPPIIRLDPKGTVSWWPSTPGRGYIGRFSDRLPCDARPRACPTGRVIRRVAPDQLIVRFEVAEPPADPRYWWRIGLSGGPDPVAPLVWIHPMASGPVTAYLTLPPEQADQVDLEAPIHVLDVIPSGAPCAGKLCVAWPPAPLQAEIKTSR